MRGTSLLGCWRMSKKRSNSSSRNPSLRERRRQEAVKKAWQRAQADSLAFEKIMPAAATKDAADDPEPKESARESGSSSRRKGASESSAPHAASKAEPPAGSASVKEHATPKREAFVPLKADEATGGKAAKAHAKQSASAKGKEAASAKGRKSASTKGNEAKGKEAAAAKAPKAPSTKAQDKASKKTAHKKRTLTKRRIALTIAACFCGVLLCGAGAFALAMNIGRTSMVQTSEMELGEGAVSYDNGKIVFYNGKKYRLNEDMTSILFLGLDGRAQGYTNGQADAVMVIAMDTSNGNVKVISIPRDSMVEIDRDYLGSDMYYDTITAQLCMAYSYADSEEQSAELMCKAVSRLLYNTPMRYYYALDMDGLGDLADAVGGVEVEALQNVKPAGITQGQIVNLTGQKAFYYIKYRDIHEPESALKRQERQKQFVKAFVKKAVEQAKGDVGMLANIFNSLAEYSKTNIGPTEFTFLAANFLGNGVGDVDIYSLQGENVLYDYDEGVDEFYLDKDSVYQTVLDVYYTEVQDEEAEAAARAAEKSIDNISDTSLGG